MTSLSFNEADDIQIKGATDGTLVGNISDRLKTTTVVTSISGSSAPHVNRVDVASVARTISGNSGTLDTDGLGCISYFVDITAASGTSPTLDIFEEGSEDGTTWFQFTQTRRFTATGNQRFQSLRLAAKYYRFRWVIGGTSPSFTFSITSTLKNYLPRRFGNKIQYGFDLTQAVNTTSEVFSAADAQNVSIVTIRAADGGSGSQYKVQVSNDDMNWTTITNAIAQNSPSENANTFQGAYRFYRLILTANSNPGTRVMDIFWAANS